MAHTFATTLRWTGNRGTGTSDYRAYGRNYEVAIAGKPDLAGSAHAVFRGDPTRHNPEDMLVAALSACHMLAYLHLCATHEVVVTAYEDEASGFLAMQGDGGHFTEVLLNPRVTISSGDEALARSLHAQAHELCFIASSVNFPVHVRNISLTTTKSVV